MKKTPLKLFQIIGPSHIGLIKMQAAIKNRLTSSSDDWSSYAIKVICTRLFFSYNEYNIFEEGSNGPHTQKSFGKFCALYKVPKIYIFILNIIVCILIRLIKICNLPSKFIITYFDKITSIRILNI